MAASAALAALLAGPDLAEGAGTKRTVVLTGANSGIGLDAAAKLVRFRPCRRKANGQVGEE